MTIQQRPETAFPIISSLTLSQAYNRYLHDKIKHRSARTMLAHHTTRCVIEDVLGAPTLVTAIMREQCRDLLETLRWFLVNHRKKHGNLSIGGAAALAKQDSQIRTITRLILTPIWPDSRK